MCQLYFTLSLGYEMRPIRVNKSLLPSNLESLHESRWRVHHRRVVDVQRPEVESDYEIEEVLTLMQLLLFVKKMF